MKKNLGSINPCNTLFLYDKDNIERIIMFNELLKNNNIADFNSIKETIKWY